MCFVISGGRMESIAAEQVTAGQGTVRTPQFPLAKFRSPALPDTLVARPRLRDRLTAGGGRRLTVVVGSAGTGKSVLLADWAAGGGGGRRAPGVGGPRGKGQERLVGGGGGGRGTGPHVLAVMRRGRR